MARIVITGGSGFVGSHLCDAFLARGDEVVAVDNLSTGRLQNIAHLAEHPGFTFVRADVCDGDPGRRPGRRRAALREPGEPARVSRDPARDARRQLARHPPRARPRARERRALPARVDERDLRRPRRAPAGRVVQRQRRPDRAPRGLRRGEALRARRSPSTYRRLYDLPTAIVRIFNTYGPRLRPSDGRVVSNFLMQAIDGKPLTMYGTGRPDPVVLLRRRRGARASSRCSTPTSAIRSTSAIPNEITMLELVDIVREVTGSRSEIVFEPLPIGDPTRRRPDITRAQTLLGWEPTVDAARRSVAHARLVPGGATPWPRVTRRAPPKLRKLSVVVPVFNERNTLVEVLRRMRAVELPDGIEREIIVVDDGSTDGTRDVLRQLGDSTVRVVMHDANRGQGRGAAHRLHARDRRVRARAGRRPRVRPRGLAEAAQSRAARPGARRVRLALHRRAAQHAVCCTGSATASCR